MSFAPGSTSPLIKILQSYLKVLGYYPIEKETSELFDETTRVAVEKFKEEAGLKPADGTVEVLVDDQTWSELTKRADKVFPPISTIQVAANKAVDAAIAQVNIPNKVANAVSQANIDNVADREVNAAIAQANISKKVNDAIVQANISTKVNDTIAQANISTKVNAAVAQADISKKVNDTIAQANISTKVSAAIAQADISTKVSAAIAQADISTKVSAAIAQADISTKVSAAIAQADISTKVSAAIAQEDIPKKVNDAIEPAKREVEEAAASAKTAAATTKAAAAAMHTFTSYRDAIVAYTEAQKIAEEIQQLTDRAVKDAGEAQSKLSATAAENAKVAVTHVQALNNQSKTELDRAKKLLAFAKIKVDDTNNEENSTNVEGNKSAKECAQKALNEIRVIAGIPSKDGFNIDIDDPALKDYKELFQRVEFKDLPTLKTEVETHAKATQEGLDTVKVTPVSSDPENLQPLMELFLDQKATSANTASASAEPQSDDYADGLMYYFELKNSASPVADSTPEKTGNAKQKSTPAG